MEAMFANFESCGHYSSVMDFCWYIIWRIHELYIFVSFLEYRYAHVNYYTNQQVSLDHIFIQWVYFTKFSQKLQKYIYTINELRIKNLELQMNSNVWIVFNVIVCCNKRLIMACSMFMSLLLQYVTLYVICHQLKMKNLFSSLLVVCT